MSTEAAKNLDTALDQTGAQPANTDTAQDATDGFNAALVEIAHDDASKPTAAERQAAATDAFVTELATVTAEMKRENLAAAGAQSALSDDPLTASLQGALADFAARSNDTAAIEAPGNALAVTDTTRNLLLKLEALQTAVEDGYAFAYDSLNTLPDPEAIKTGFKALKGAQGAIDTAFRKGSVVDLTIPNAVLDSRKAINSKITRVIGPVLELLKTSSTDEATRARATALTDTIMDARDDFFLSQSDATPFFSEGFAAIGAKLHAFIEKQLPRGEKDKTDAIFDSLAEEVFQHTDSVRLVASIAAGLDGKKINKMFDNNAKGSYRALKDLVKAHSDYVDVAPEIEAAEAKAQTVGLSEAETIELGYWHELVTELREKSDAGLHTLAVHGRILTKYPAVIASALPTPEQTKEDSAEDLNFSRLEADMQAAVAADMSAAGFLETPEVEAEFETPAAVAAIETLNVKEHQELVSVLLFHEGLLKRDLQQMDPADAQTIAKLESEYLPLSNIIDVLSEMPVQETELQRGNPDQTVSDVLKRNLIDLEAAGFFEQIKGGDKLAERVRRTTHFISDAEVDMNLRLAHVPELSDGIDNLNVAAYKAAETAVKLLPTDSELHEHLHTQLPLLYKHVAAGKDAAALNSPADHTLYNYETEALINKTFDPIGEYLSNFSAESLSDEQRELQDQYIEKIGNVTNKKFEFFSALSLASPMYGDTWQNLRGGLAQLCETKLGMAPKQTVAVLTRLENAVSRYPDALQIFEGMRSGIDKPRTALFFKSGALIATLGALKAVGTMNQDGKHTPQAVFNALRDSFKKLSTIGDTSVMSEKRNRRIEPKLNLDSIGDIEDTSPKAPAFGDEADAQGPSIATGAEAAEGESLATEASADDDLGPLPLRTRTPKSEYTAKIGQKIKPVVAFGVGAVGTATAFTGAVVGAIAKKWPTVVISSIAGVVVKSAVVGGVMGAGAGPIIAAAAAGVVVGALLTSPMSYHFNKALEADEAYSQAKNKFLTKDFAKYRGKELKAGMVAVGKTAFDLITFKSLGTAAASLVLGPKALADAYKTMRAQNKLAIEDTGKPLGFIGKLGAIGTTLKDDRHFNTFVAMVTGGVAAGVSATFADEIKEATQLVTSKVAGVLGLNQHADVATVAQPVVNPHDTIRAGVDQPAAVVNQPAAVIDHPVGDQPAIVAHPVPVEPRIVVEADGTRIRILPDQTREIFKPGAIAGHGTLVVEHASVNGAAPVTDAALPVKLNADGTTTALSPAEIRVDAIAAAVGDRAKVAAFVQGSPAVQNMLTETQRLIDTGIIKRPADIRLFQGLIEHAREGDLRALNDLRANISEGGVFDGNNLRHIRGMVIDRTHGTFARAVMQDMQDYMDADNVKFDGRAFRIQQQMNAAHLQGKGVDGKPLYRAPQPVEQQPRVAATEPAADAVAGAVGVNVPNSNALAQQLARMNYKVEVASISGKIVVTGVPAASDSDPIGNLIDRFNAGSTPASVEVVQVQGTGPVADATRIAQLSLIARGATPDQVNALVGHVNGNTANRAALTSIYRETEGYLRASHNGTLTAQEETFLRRLRTTANLPASALRP